MHNTMSSKSIHQAQKNANVNIDSGLFINCTFDTDYLEVTKTEPLRKYEENIYLFGSIFSNKTSEKDIKNDKEELENENDESIDEEIMSLFAENQTNKNFENDIEKINNLIKNTSFETEKENELLNQLLFSVEDYKETLKFLKQTKENFSNELKDFNDLNQKLRSSKNIEGDIHEIISKADQFGILPNTFKQQENFLRKKRDLVAPLKTEIAASDDEKPKMNKDLPWNQNDNFVVMNI